MQNKPWFFFSHKHGVPKWGGGAPPWEKFPHFPVFLGGGASLSFSGWLSMKTSLSILSLSQHDSCNLSAPYAKACAAEKCMDIINLSRKLANPLLTPPLSMTVQTNVFLSKIPRCHAICFWPLFLLYLSKYITQFLFLGVGCIKSVSQDRLWLTSRRHVYGIFSTQFHQSPTTYDRHTSVKWYMWTKFSKRNFYVYLLDKPQRHKVEK